MSFQLSILKILDGQTDGRASLEVIKQHLAVLYTSGEEWTGRMKRLAGRAPNLDIFGHKLVVREPGVWSITEEGRTFLAILERRTAVAENIVVVEPSSTAPAPTASLKATAVPNASGPTADTAAHDQ